MSKATATTSRARALQPGLVSVLMPTYNSLEFLESRIESIRDQIHASFEVIVVDGYSKDGTWARLQAVAREDPRWHLRQSNPAGAYAAINEAMDAARGEYIYFAMSDDTCDARLLRTAVALMGEMPHVDVVQFAVAVIDESDRLLYDTRFVGDFADYFGDFACVPHERSLTGDLTRQAVMTSLYISLTGLVVRTALARQAGSFPDSLSAIADVVWTSRLCARGGSVCYVPKLYATWRRHRRQLTTKKTRDEIAKAYTSKLQYIRSLFTEEEQLILRHLTEKTMKSAQLQNCNALLHPQLWSYCAEDMLLKGKKALAWLQGGARAVQRVRGSEMRGYASPDDIQISG